MTHGPVIDVMRIEEATRLGVAEGHRIFQPHRQHASDAMHVAVMLSDLHPPQGATVLDAGCGIGEVARLMSEQRHDLSFILANVSPLQLSMCPRGPRFQHVLADCHHLPLASASVDAVMFCASLCQMEQLVALREARRVARPGAVLMLREMVALTAIPAAMQRALGVAIPTKRQLLDALDAAGWQLQWLDWPPGDDTHFRELLARDGLHNFANCVAHVVLRAVAKEATRDQDQEPRHHQAGGQRAHGLPGVQGPRVADGGQRLARQVPALLRSQAAQPGP